MSPVRRSSRSDQSAELANPRIGAPNAGVIGGKKRKRPNVVYCWDSSGRLIDDHNFSIRLKAPFVFTEFLLGGSNGVVGAIMREKDAMIDPFTPVKERIGSGPFRFMEAEYRSGAKLVYEKCDGYVPRSEPASGFAGGNVAKVDRVEWVIIPDTSVAFNALHSGEVDMRDAPPLDLLPTVTNDRNIVIGEVWPLESYAVLRFNSIHLPFNNVKGAPGGGACVQPD
jgi:peptide/nickel transport system substrate-binding protein